MGAIKFINYQAFAGTMDDLEDRVDVVDIQPSADDVRAVIRKRLEFAEEYCGSVPGSLIQITDAGYQAICDLTQSSPGMALQVVKMVFPSLEQLRQNRPYIITEKQIQDLHLDYQTLCQYWDSGLMDAIVVEIKRE